MDGYQATQAIRGLGPDRSEVVIVALTAHAMRGDRDRCLRAGMDGYITKPVDRADLEQALRLTRRSQIPVRPSDRFDGGDT